MRQFILEKQNVKNGLITLEGKDFKYLRQVLRVKVGDMLNVRFPDGTLQNTTVAQIDEKSKKIIIQICASTEKSITRGVQATEFNNKLPDIEYWLFQFIPKAVKLEQIVRQATECGVSVIVPIIGEYSEKNSVNALEGAKKERLDRIIREARQQSGSPVDTKILAPVSLEDAVGRWKEFCSDSQNESVAFVLSERDDCNDNLRDVVNKTASIKKVAIAVGSEGGISPDEVAFLQEKGLFYPIHFAVNILRCETAALYGIAAVQSAIN